MSNFSVMVIGQNIEKQLAPFHEFECTGVVDEYVQSVDKLEQAKADYADTKRTYLLGPDGELESPYDYRFYRDLTEEEAQQVDASSSHGLLLCGQDWRDGKGWRHKVKHIPEGWQQVEKPVSSVITLLDFILEDYTDFPVLKEGDEPDLHDRCKWGWVRVNADNEVIECIDRTNPNTKWDWYQIGGRFSDRLKLKTSENQDQVRTQVSTDTGPVLRDGNLYVDQALKREIDFEGMRDEAGLEAAAKWDKAAEAKVAAGFSSDTAWEPWVTVRERYPVNIEAARDKYHSQSAMRVVGEALSLWSGVDQFLAPRHEYIQQARDSALVQHALVKDSQWFAQGEMGWFGMSSDEMSVAEWNRKLNELLDELPDDTLITIVDCHI